MRYQNPLSVFTPDQIEKILSGNYKNVKKYILLQFQLEEGITINLNGQEIDKNGVLQVFDAIDDQVELHAAIYQNKPLLAFLEEEEFNFFVDRKNFTQLNESPQKEELTKLLIKKINGYLGQRLRKFNAQNVFVLKHIFSYTSLLPIKEQTEAYTEAYKSMMTYMDDLEKLLPDPFAKNGKTFKPSVSKLVNLDQIEFFKYLPASFENLNMKYVIWCNDNILLKALSQESTLGKYSRVDLESLKTAATIASTQFNKENNLEIADTITRYKKRGKTRKAIFIFILLALIFKGFFTKSDGPKDLAVSDYNYISGLEKVISQNDMTTAQTVDLKKHFGLSSPTVTYGDTTIIKYSCQHIPNTKRWLTQLTNSALETKSDTNQILKLSLIDKDNPSISLDYIYKLNLEGKYVISGDSTRSAPLTLTNNLASNKSINIAKSRISEKQSISKHQKYKLKQLDEDTYKIWSLKDLRSQTINYNEPFDTEKKYLMDTILLKSIIRNNVNTEGITIDKSIEIVSNQHYYKLVKAPIVNILMRQEDKGRTVRYRKLESVDQDVIKVIGDNYCSLIFLNETGQITHKQTVIRNNKQLEVIKEWPVT